MDKNIQWVVQKVSDEGGSDPYHARLWLGLNELYPMAFDVKRRQDLKKEFLEAYQPVLDAMAASRLSAKQLCEIITVHEQRIKSGSNFRVTHNSLQVMDVIEPVIQKEFRAFISQGEVALKEVQKVLKILGFDMGFFYQKELGFQAEIQAMRTHGLTPFADYLEAVRSTWSEKFIELSNNIKHNGWTLPMTEHKLMSDGSVCVVQPTINDLLLVDFVVKHLNRLLSFIEELQVFCIQLYVGLPFAIFEIPPEQREPGAQRRFKLGLYQGTFWCPIYKETTEFLKV